MNDLYRVPDGRARCLKPCQSCDEARLLRRKWHRVAFRVDAADIGHVLDERSRRYLPGMPCGKFEAGLRRDPQAREHPAARSDGRLRRAEHMRGTVTGGEQDRTPLARAVHALQAVRCRVLDSVHEALGSAPDRRRLTSICGCAWIRACGYRRKPASNLPQGIPGRYRRERSSRTWPMSAASTRNATRCHFRRSSRASSHDWHGFKAPCPPIGGRDTSRS